MKPSPLSLKVGLLMLALGIPGILNAGDVPQDPQLRINTEMHTDVIKKITSDNQGRWVLTSSRDKTARVWDAKTGVLLKVLRPPVGPGNEGTLSAAALSPDGSLAAVGGWTGQAWNGSHQVYIFDRASGTLLRTLPNMPNVICNLTFSPDGRYLAAGLVGAYGIRVWDLKQSTPVYQDPAYGKDCYGTAWTRNGQLATSSYDGKIRLYTLDSRGLTKKKEVTATAGNRPFGLAFHPEGTRLAVGFEDSPQLEIYDGSNLNLVQTLSGPEKTGDMGAVAWSADGMTIVSGGTVGYPRALRSWQAPDFKKFTDTPTVLNIIMSIHALPGGGVLVGAADPAWGLVTPEKVWKPLGASPTADLRNLTNAFTLDARGEEIQFGYEPKGVSPWHFNLSRRSLTAGPLAGGTSPDSTSLNITDWKDKETPKLNGKSLPLVSYEVARSVAVAPDKSRFILGTGYNLRCFDPQGTLLWSVPAPAAWDVNIPSSGRLVVAGLGDGTIRWYRLADGKELLAFFPHADKKRWVLWTPSGYYDASPGAEDLIGWHLNRKQDQAADFFPSSRFRDRFYRPDVIDQILQTLDEGQALAKANEARGAKTQTSAALNQTLPPVIDLVSNSDISTNQTALLVQFRVRTSADAPVLKVRGRINGQVTESKGLAVEAAGDPGVQSFLFNIPKASCEVQVFAENRHGVSVPATVRVTWTGSQDAFVIKPKLYLLAVGVGAYSNKEIPKLNLAAKDARDFAATLKAQQGKLYREVEVRILTDAQATRDEVVDGLDWLQKQVTQHDIGMLFLSGHGLNDPTQGYVYLPVNADLDKLKRTGVAMNDIRDTLAGLTGKAVFFLDTCHSGNVLGSGRKAVTNDINAVVNELSSAENGVVVFSSSTGRQYSLESPEWGNGAFTKALIEGLKGQADFQGTGRITFKMLDLYISERVKALTSGRQSPVTQAPGGVPDFPLATK